jgi:hypothetical protein
MRCHTLPVSASPCRDHAAGRDGLRPRRDLRSLFTVRATRTFVMSIGFAAIRDIVSFLRYETKANPLTPQGRPRIRRALGCGISQSDRVLRDLVHLGFNQELAGRQCSTASFRRRRVSPHLSQLAVCTGRTLFAPARRSLLRRRPVPVQLSDLSVRTPGRWLGNRQPAPSRGRQRADRES